MEFAGYLRIEGNVQGAITGACLRKGREGSIVVYDFKHEISKPYQSDTQIGTSSIFHHPITITKEVDESSPKLYQSIVERERLKINFSWYRFINGNEKLYYQMMLEEASLISIAPFTPSMLQKENESKRFMESIMIAYNKIYWSWGEHGDITYSTNWRSQD